MVVCLLTKLFRVSICKARCYKQWYMKAAISHITLRLNNEIWDYTLVYQNLVLNNLFHVCAQECLNFCFYVEYPCNLILKLSFRFLQWALIGQVIQHELKLLIVRRPKNLFGIFCSSWKQVFGIIETTNTATILHEYITLPWYCLYFVFIFPHCLFVILCSFLVLVLPSSSFPYPPLPSSSFHILPRILLCLYVWPLAIYKILHILYLKVCPIRLWEDINISNYQTLQAQ